MEHTKGNWKVAKNFKNNDGSIVVVPEHQDEEQMPICTVICQTKFKRGQGWLTECSERDANARLIASAPELLAFAEYAILNCQMNVGRHKDVVKLVNYIAGKAD